MAVRDLIDGEFFDWYQVTFNGGRIGDASKIFGSDKSTGMDSNDDESVAGVARRLIEDIKNQWKGSSAQSVRPRVNQYGVAADVVLGSMVVAHVCWGGCNSGVHLISTGHVANSVANWLMSKESGYVGLYAVSRADVKIDLVDDAAWEYLFGAAERFSLERKIKTQHVGDWLTGEAGRTFYMGSKSSVAQVRIYEKGKKEGGDENWVRLEAQIRPSKSQQKKDAAFFRARDFFMGSSRWLADFYNSVLLEANGCPEKYLGTVWKRTDQQSALMAMVKQYGKRIMELSDELGGPDKAGEFLFALTESCGDLKKQKGGMGVNPFDEIMNDFKQGLDCETGELKRVV